MCYQQPEVVSTQPEVVSTGLCYHSIVCFIQDCYLLQLAHARFSVSQAGAKRIQVGSPSGRGDWWQRRPPMCRMRFGYLCRQWHGSTNPAVVLRLGARRCLTHATGRSAVGPEHAPDGLMPGCLHTALPFNGERTHS